MNIYISNLRVKNKLVSLCVLLLCSQWLGTVALLATVLGGSFSDQMDTLQSLHSVLTTVRHTGLISTQHKMVVGTDTESRGAGGAAATLYRQLPFTAPNVVGFL